MTVHASADIGQWDLARGHVGAVYDSGVPGNRQQSKDVPPGETSQSRLGGLDGIRGLAALFVVFHHCYLMAFPGYPESTGPFWAGWFIYGQFAVVIFIVLSGFSLAVSPAKHGWELGSVRRFAHRRVWRILPPYWAALAFSLLIAWFVVPQPGEAVPDLKSVVVNGLLAQDLVGASTPNGAFWSIAIEAQLYIVFPFLLILVRRINGFAMAALCTGVVALVGALGPHSSLVDKLMRFTPQLAALFAMGVVAAGIVVAGRRRAWPWHWIALATASPVLILIMVNGSVWTIRNFLWIDMALGPAIGCLLAAVATGRPRPVVRLLDTPPIKRLGSFSYSLYLVHAPIVVVFYDKIVAGWLGHGVAAFLVTVILAVPVSIAFAWFFASIFEIPFQKHRSLAALRENWLVVGVRGMRENPALARLRGMSENPVVARLRAMAENEVVGRLRRTRSRTRPVAPTPIAARSAPAGGREVQPVSSSVVEDADPA
jgi:peptidoglycan/LPS O-acetylase OafA/YrhL